MLGHVSFYVKDYEKGKEFFGKALEPLGYKLIKDFKVACGFGVGGKADFWIVKSDKPLHPQHISFTAPDQETVKKFYDSALAAGGTDNGAPGPRADYGPTYYGAFVLDPEGNNIEAAL